MTHQQAAQVLYCLGVIMAALVIVATELAFKNASPRFRWAFIAVCIVLLAFGSLGVR